MATDRARQLCRQIYELIDRGDIRRAGPACEQLVREFPDYANGWAAFSELWLRCGRSDQARECAEKSCSLAPGSAALRAQSAKCHLFAGDTRRALELAEEVLDMQPETHETLDTVGNVFSRLGEHRRALEIFEQALELAPDNTTALYNLATSLRFHGRSDEAETLFERIIERDPDDHQAIHSRSVLRRQTETRNHIDDLEARLAADPPWPASSHIACALAKEYDDLGRFAESFGAVRRGADDMRRHRPDRHDADLADIDAVIDALKAGLIGAGQSPGHDSDEPIFIIGLPRTGSTLIERILDGHPEVFVAGELHNFQVEARHMTGGKSAAQVYRTVSDDLDAHDFARLGRDYIDSTRPRTGQTPKFIDKLPRNFLWAGLIHRALPQAKFILTARHPMDTCYAMYRTLFHTGYHFSYDLESLGHYYLAYRRLIDALKRALPEASLMEVSYEALVQEPEDHARALTAFCGLDWREECLAFHERDSAVVTASAHQVREPVYTSSVGKWRQVEGELEPLRRVLVDGGVTI